MNTEGLDYVARDSADPLAWWYANPLRAAGDLRCSLLSRGKSHASELIARWIRYDVRPARKVTSKRMLKHSSCTTAVSLIPLLYSPCITYLHY